MQEKEILRADKITKKYGDKLILKDIDLSVKTGEAVAFVGENGCGKSTLIKLLTGISVPGGGSVWTRNGIKTAFIPDRFEKVSLTIPQFMKHMQLIEGNKPDENILEEYYENFYLKNMLDIPMKNLSKGTLQKAAVIQALIGERDVIYMDEPLSGQDYMSQAYFIEEIQRRKKKGTAIVMACHEPYLIEEIADVVYQIKDARLVDGSSYLYRKKKTKSIFILRNQEGINLILDSLNSDKSDEEKLSITVQGKIVKIISCKSISQSIFRLLVDNDVQIIKYEEI